MAKHKQKEEIQENEFDQNEVSGYIVRDDLGFEKRNYFIDGQKILLEAGKPVSNEIYNLFSDYCKEIFFK